MWHRHQLIGIFNVIEYCPLTWSALMDGAQTLLMQRRIFRSMKEETHFMNHRATTIKDEKCF